MTSIDNSKDFVTALNVLLTAIHEDIGDDPTSVCQSTLSAYRAYVTEIEGKLLENVREFPSAAKEETVRIMDITMKVLNMQKRPLNTDSSHSKITRGALELATINQHVSGTSAACTFCATEFLANRFANAHNTLEEITYTGMIKYTELGRAGNSNFFEAFPKFDNLFLCQNQSATLIGPNVWSDAVDILNREGPISGAVITIKGDTSETFSIQRRETTAGLEYTFYDSHGDKLRNGADGAYTRTFYNESDLKAFLNGIRPVSSDQFGHKFTHITEMGVNIVKPKFSDEGKRAILEQFLRNDPKAPFTPGLRMRAHAGGAQNAIVGAHYEEITDHLSPVQKRLLNTIYRFSAQTNTHQLNFLVQAVANMFGIEIAYTDDKNELIFRVKKAVLQSLAEKRRCNKMNASTAVQIAQITGNLNELAEVIRSEHPHFHAGNKDKTFEWIKGQFDALSPEQKNTFYGAIWELHGRPHGDPKFGQHNLYNNWGISMEALKRARG
jgi:hypothetical protein